MIAPGDARHKPADSSIVGQFEIQKARILAKVVSSSGLIDHVRDIEELVALRLDPKAEKRGPYKKRDVA
jgi:hypothetical protein